MMFQSILFRALLALGVSVGTYNSAKYGAIAPSTSIEGTTCDITLQVSTTGSDSDPARPTRITCGDYTAHPFLTIQASYNALPKMIRNSVLTTVGAGTFAGAVVSGFKLDSSSSSAAPALTLMGSFSNSTLASGTATGTATSGSLSNGLSTLTDSGQGWTSSDLRGRFLIFTAGSCSATATTAGLGTNYALFTIVDNTATAITFRSGQASCTPSSSSVYRIVDLTSHVQKTTAGSGITGALNVQYVDGFIAKLLWLGGNSATAGYNVNDTFSVYGYGLRCDDTGEGQCVLASAGTKFQLAEIYSKGVTNALSISRYEMLFANDLVTDTGATPISLADIVRTSINGFDIRSCTSVGMSYTRMDFIATTTGNIQNCTSHAMSLSDVRESTHQTIAGTGNGGFGLTIANTGYHTTSSPNSAGGMQVTGTSGDFSIDGSTQTWATLSGLSTGGKLQNNNVVVSR